MKKIYILLGIVAAAFTACDKSSEFDTVGEGLKTTPITPKDTVPNTPGHQWETVVGKSLPIDENMMATPWIFFNCTDGKRDSVQMESWLLDINTADMTIYRESYQATTKSGITPNAERSSSDPYIDKFGNTVQRHSYTQPFKFNNFTHSISGAWNTGYLSYNGKQESYWPEDGLYYELTNISGNTVADTTHFVRNDTIYAKEVVHITYKATLHILAGKPAKWRSWERSATITVISFIGIVEKKITADDYIPNLKWHAEHANRFWNGSAWCDGILFSSNSHWYMLISTFKLNHDGTKEEVIELRMDSIAKADMVTPAAGREFNGVMWDESKNRPIPCRLTVDGNGWSLGSEYADGTRLTKRHDRNEAVMSGVKNLSEEDNATPSPWIASNWTESKYNGVNYYAVTWKTTTHTLARTIADSNLKK